MKRYFMVGLLVCVAATQALAADYGINIDVSIRDGSGAKQFILGETLNDVKGQDYDKISQALRQKIRQDYHISLRECDTPYLCANKDVVRTTECKLVFQGTPFLTGVGYEEYGHLYTLNGVECVLKTKPAPYIYAAFTSHENTRYSTGVKTADMVPAELNTDHDPNDLSLFLTGNALNQRLVLEKPPADAE